MIRKFFSTMLLVLSFTASAFAASNTLIFDASKQEVLDFIIKSVSQSNQNVMLESVNDYGVNFVASKSINNVFGNQIASQQNKISFTAVQDNNNVILSVSEIATIYENNGKMSVQPINDTVQESVILAGIREYFNDYYIFGIVLSDKKRDGGLIM